MPFSYKKLEPSIHTTVRNNCSIVEYILQHHAYNTHIASPSETLHNLPTCIIEKHATYRVYYFDSSIVFHNSILESIVYTHTFRHYSSTLATFFLFYMFLIEKHTTDLYTQLYMIKLRHSEIYRFDITCTTCLYINRNKDSSNTCSSFCWNKTATIAFRESIHHILFIHT